MGNVLWNPAANNPSLKEPTTGSIPDAKSVYIFLS